MGSIVHCIFVDKCTIGFDTSSSFSLYIYENKGRTSDHNKHGTYVFSIRSFRACRWISFRALSVGRIRAASRKVRENLLPARIWHRRRLFCLLAFDPVNMDCRQSCMVKINCQLVWWCEFYYLSRAVHACTAFS